MNLAKQIHEKILESKRVLSRPWFDRLCSWCGKEFNQMDPGTKRKYCSQECLTEGDRTHHTEVKKVVKREKRLDRISDRLEHKRLRLRENFGANVWFTTTQARFCLQLTPNNTQVTLEALKEKGKVRRRKRLAGGGYEWSVY